MLKVRLMGTKKDIVSFQDKIKDLPGILITGKSDIYGNKGTNRFFRNYMEIIYTKKDK